MREPGGVSSRSCVGTVWLCRGTEAGGFASIKYSVVPATFTLVNAVRVERRNRDPPRRRSGLGRSAAGTSPATSPDVMTLRLSRPLCVRNGPGTRQERSAEWVPRPYARALSHTAADLASGGPRLRQRLCRRSRGSRLRLVRRGAVPPARHTPGTHGSPASPAWHTCHARCACGAHKLLYVTVVVHSPWPPRSSWSSSWSSGSICSIF